MVEKKHKSTKGNTDVSVFSKMLDYEKKMQNKLAAELGKKEQEVLKLQAQLEKNHAQLVAKGRTAAANEAAESTKRAKADAKKNAAEFEDEKQTLQERFAKGKKEITQAVIAQMFTGD